jgi:DNA-binding winged helix-turn-helix (wHTH) protein/TolB-like protein
LLGAYEILTTRVLRFFWRFYDFLRVKEKAENTGSIYEFGEFLLDPGEKSLSMRGHPIRLPVKAFETLLLLVVNNQHALSKDEMIAAIWPDAFVEEGNLAKQISQLRKVLNTNGTQFIETLPKHGYRFSADLRTIAPVDEALIIERRVDKRVSVKIETEDAATLALPAKRFGNGPRTAVIAALLIVMGVAGVFFWSRQNSLPPLNESKIAVLPMRSLSGSQEDQALGLGLTDALITKVGSLKRVIVRPINAVSSFAGDDDALTLGRRLNVDAVFEGTIQDADGRLRVNARLLKTATGEQIWADKFDQPAAGGVFALQDALSTSIAKTLDLELSTLDFDRLRKRGTDNAEAYEKYLRGRFFQTQNNGDGFDRSLSFYRQAVALDANFAEAHAGIADAGLLKFNFGLSKADEAIPPARAEIDQALQLNPDLPDAYTSLALIQFLVDRDWRAAEKSLNRAIELDVNNVDAYHRYGYFLMRLGRFDEAQAKFDKALELNPLAAISRTNKGLTYLCARQYPQAAEQLETTVSENPKFTFPRYLLAESYEASGDNERAFLNRVEALRIDGASKLADRMQQLKTTEGLEAATRLWVDESVKSRSISDSELAVMSASIKDRDRTLFWLEKAGDDQDTYAGGIAYLAKFDFVRDDPRFKDFQAKMPF